MIRKNFLTYMQLDTVQRQDIDCSDSWIFFNACNTFQKSWARNMFTAVRHHLLTTFSSVWEFRTLIVKVLKEKFFPILALHTTSVLQQSGAFCCKNLHFVIHLAVGSVVERGRPLIRGSVVRSPTPSSLDVEVSLGKILNPKLPLMAVPLVCVKPE